MRTLRRVAIWTAAVSAATATGCIVAYLSGANPRSHALIAADIAATIGAASLLASLLVVHLLTRRQPRIKQAPWGDPGDPPVGDCVASLHKRRGVLDARLNIDEPRLCSQHLISCTCWSFCAGSEGERSMAEAERFLALGTSPAAQELIRLRNRLAQAQVLPLVHRSGMDGCPFRFASPYARRAPAEGVGPISSRFAMATR